MRRDGVVCGDGVGTMWGWCGDFVETVWRCCEGVWEFVGWPGLKVNPRNEEVYVTVNMFGRKFHT